MCMFGQLNSLSLPVCFIRIHPFLIWPRCSNRYDLKHLLKLSRPRKFVWFFFFWNLLLPSWSIFKYVTLCVTSLFTVNVQFIHVCSQQLKLVRVLRSLREYWLTDVWLMFSRSAPKSTAPSEQATSVIPRDRPKASLPPSAGSLALPIQTSVTPRRRPSASNPQTPVAPAQGMRMNLFECSFNMHYDILLVNLRGLLLYRCMF